MDKKSSEKSEHQGQTQNNVPQIQASCSTSPEPTSSNSMPTITEMTNGTMTSREFHGETHAHIEFAAHVLRDQSYIFHFQDVIDLNKHLFRGKTVLDIRCGTGILSLFSAKAGAARVFAVDSSNVVDYTRKIVAANNYANVIEVIKGHIEDVCLPVKQVDIIICNWMGYSLFYQSTCRAVIYARDKWLRRNSGIIFPDFAKLYIVGFEDTERKVEKIDWWKNVYGFNMKCLRELALQEPYLYEVHPNQLLTTAFKIKTLNLYTAKVSDLNWSCFYTMEMVRNGWIDGVVTYFNVHFSKSHKPFMFSTDPWSDLTHWKQTVFFFNEAVPVRENEVIYGGFQMTPADREQPDLNNIEVSLELCCKEPLQLMVDIKWKMKAYTANAATADDAFLLGL